MKSHEEIGLIPLTVRIQTGINKSLCYIIAYLYQIVKTYSIWRPFGEDGSQVRCGNAPQVMAALRNMVIGLMRSIGRTNIAAACHKFAAKPGLALDWNSSGSQCKIGWFISLYSS